MVTGGSLVTPHILKAYRLLGPHTHIPNSDPIGALRVPFGMFDQLHVVVPQPALVGFCALEIY